MLEPNVIKFIEGDSTVWEQGPMNKLASLGQLGAHKHFGFWRPMDTLSDKQYLENLWNKNQAPWKVWHDK